MATGDDKVVILPNGTLANSSLTNVTQTPYRRNELKIGISYESDIKKAKEILYQLMEEDEAVVKDMDKVVFVDDLGASNVILGVRCWFGNDEYWTGRWRLLENAKYALEENGIVFAYPQMDVHIQK